MKFQCKQSQTGHAVLGQIVNQFDFLGPTQEDRQKHFTADEQAHPAFKNEQDAPRRLLHQVKQAVDGRSSFGGSVNPESQRQLLKEFTDFSVYLYEPALDAQKRYNALQQRLPVTIRDGHTVEYSLNAFARAFTKDHLLADQAKMICERELRNARQDNAVLTYNPEALALDLTTYQNDEKIVLPQKAKAKKPTHKGEKPKRRFKGGRGDEQPLEAANYMNNDEVRCYFCNDPVHKTRSPSKGKGKGGKGSYGRGNGGARPQSSEPAPAGFCLGPGRCRYKGHHEMLTKLLHKRKGILDNDLAEMLSSGRSFVDQVKLKHKNAQSFTALASSSSNHRQSRSSSPDSNDDFDEESDGEASRNSRKSNRSQRRGRKG
jgi:hypothetical protein